MSHRLPTAKRHIVSGILIQPKIRHIHIDGTGFLGAAGRHQTIACDPQLEIPVSPILHRSDIDRVIGSHTDLLRSVIGFPGLPAGQDIFVRIAKTVKVYR